MLNVNIKKSLGNILFEASFQMEDSGITAVFGESGAGKTTLINIIAGIVKADSGYVTFNGRDFFNSDKNINLPVHKRLIGYVFQDSRLFPNMSVKKNLLYGSRRIGKNSLQCDFNEVCSLLGITHLLERYPHNLSGGEKQRTAIARALLSNPEILLMDEPLASLDEKRRDEFIDYINIIQNRYKIPVLYVTHSMDEILRLADKACYMNNGKLLYYGEVTDVLNKAGIYGQNKDYGVVFEGFVKECNKAAGTVLINFGGGVVEIPSDNIEEGRKVRFSVNINDVVLSTSNIDKISIRNKYQGIVKEIIKRENNFYDICIDTGADLWARVSSGAFYDLEIKKGMQIYAMIKSAVISSSLKLVH